MFNKTIKTIFLLMLLLAIPGYAFAGLSEKCFPGVECDSGKDYYGSSTGAYSCQTHINTIAANCGGNNNFSCENGCYTSGGGGSTPTYCSEANQAFKTNASGANVCGVVDDGDWTQSGGNLYRLSGKVGIGAGETNPGSVLEVNGDIKGTSLTSIGTASIGTAPTNTSSSILELNSTSKGLLLPRISSLSAILNPIAGLIVYNPSNYPSPSPVFYNGTSWADMRGPQGPQGPTYGIYNSLNTPSLNGLTGLNLGDAGGATMYNLGNVGIGTSSNTNAALEVKGKVRLSGSASGYVDLQPAASGSAATFTLPSSTGTNGQFLKTDGSGVLSWTNGPVFLGSTSSYNGSRGGYATANNLCKNSSIGGRMGSHICTSQDIINSYAQGVLPGTTATGMLWVNNGAPGYIKSLSNDCGGWNTSYVATYGSAININRSGLTANSFYSQPCSTSYSFACCI
jgi:hypothetical protein